MENGLVEELVVGELVLAFTAHGFDAVFLNTAARQQQKIQLTQRSVKSSCGILTVQLKTLSAPVNPLTFPVQEFGAARRQRGLRKYDTPGVTRERYDQQGFTWRGGTTLLVDRRRCQNAESTSQGEIWACGASRSSHLGLGGETWKLPSRMLPQRNCEWKNALLQASTTRLRWTNGTLWRIDPKGSSCKFDSAWDATRTFGCFWRCEERRGQ